VTENSPPVGGSPIIDRESLVRALGAWGLRYDPAPLRALAALAPCDGELGRLVLALLPELDRPAADPLAAKEGRLACDPFGAVDRLQAAGDHALAALLRGLLWEVTEREGARDEEDLEEGADEDAQEAIPSSEKRRPSQAATIAKLATGAEVELFESDDGDGRAYATFAAGDHHETYSIRSRRFRMWLTQLFYKAEGKAPGRKAVEEALDALEAEAVHGGITRSACVRLAQAGGRIYLDLADAGWRVVEIDVQGWRLIEAEAAPVRFWRPRGVLPLPAPEGGGSVEDLRAYLNVNGDDDFRLVMAWEIAALRPRGPYPILALQGEQGSAKSTTARILRFLVDPNRAPVRAEPREPRDMMIAARNGWIVALDNLSRIPDWLSDALCRLATGGGFSTRQLYTDEEEILFEAQRPIILNGIEDLATRGDLLDRAIVITLPTIPEEKRRDEEALWSELEASRPRLLGALLDGVAGALREFPGVRLAPPRMADFAKWATAGERALGWPAGSVLRAYTQGRDDAIGAAIDGDLVASAIRDLAGKPPAYGWSGTSTELLKLLTPKDGKPPKGWPSTPQTLSGALRRAGPGLRRLGVEVTFEREGKPRRRVIIVRQVEEDKPGETPSSPSASSAPLSEMADGTSDSRRRGALPSALPSAGFPSEADAADAADGCAPPMSHEAPAGMGRGARCPGCGRYLAFARPRASTCSRCST
jgi:hypothetical protein